MDSKIKYVREPSQRQLNAVWYWVQGKCGSKATALTLAGYSDAISRNPSKFFNSPAVRLLLRDMGIKNRTDVLLEDDGRDIVRKTVKKVYRERAPVQETTVQDNPLKNWDPSTMTDEEVAILKAKLEEVQPLQPAPTTGEGYSSKKSIMEAYRESGNTSTDPFELGEIKRPPPSYKEFSSM